MGLNLSRGKPTKYYSSNRIASIMGNGLLTFIDEKVHMSDFFNKNEIILKKLGRISNILNKDQDKSSASLIIKGELYKMYFEQDVDLKTIKDIPKKISYKDFSNFFTFR